MTTTEQLAHLLSAAGHRVVYELQVNCHNEPVGERLWHIDLCPKCVSDRLKQLGESH